MENVTIAVFDDTFGNLIQIQTIGTIRANRAKAIPPKAILPKAILRKEILRKGIPVRA